MGWDDEPTVRFVVQPVQIVKANQIVVQSEVGAMFAQMRKEVVQGWTCNGAVPNGEVASVAQRPQNSRPLADGTFRGRQQWYFRGAIAVQCRGLEKGAHTQLVRRAPRYLADLEVAAVISVDIQLGRRRQKPQ